MAYNYRIHPAIGIARVGNSKDYYLGPETMAGDGPTGGLPIRPGTEDTTITSSDLRDAGQAFKRPGSGFISIPHKQAPRPIQMD